MKYLSFSKSTKEERIRGLKLNSILNTKCSCKHPEDADILDKAIFGRNESAVLWIAMNVSKNRIKMF